MYRWVPIVAAFILAASLSLLLFSCQSTPTKKRASSPEVTRISNKKLHKMLNDPRLVLIDTRYKQQWDRAEFKLPGAEHRNPGKAEEWGKDLPRDRIIVTYCA